MRVCSGEFKGRVLEENKFRHIRPTAELVKQALFNALGDKVLNCRLLDLFSGTGALGIEAISRGAGEVVFVDKDARSVGLVKANLAKLGIKGQVVKKDFKDYLKNYNGEQFDIILLDPPYKNGLYNESLNLINEKNILHEDGVVVCEHAKDEIINFDTYNVQSQKRYGTKILTFLTKK